MEISNHVYDTNSEVFLNKVRDYFTNVGLLVCKNLPNQHNSGLKIYFERCCQSYAFLHFTKLLKMKSMSAIIISRTTSHQVLMELQPNLLN